MQESADYAKRRAQLLEAEIALKDQRERVAALRRELPLETEVPDHRFRDAAGEVPLSELFEDPAQPLVLVHFMYGKQQAEPCPMCTLWADGYDGIVPHLRQRVNFAVLIAGDPEAFSAHAAQRGWRHLRIVSAADSSFKADVGLEDADGAQSPGVSVLVRGEGGRLLHFYTGGASLAGQFRGMDLLSPFWNFLDLTPEGRGDFMPSRHYA